jgi:hypothetical protein
VHQFHDWVNGVNLKPFFAKVGAVGMFVMIILKQFAQH